MGKWTEEETEFVRHSAAYMRDEDVAAAVSRMRNAAVSLDALRKFRQRMGLAKKRGRGVVGLEDIKG